jgi:putative Mn2+ efflux pump MntP
MAQNANIFISGFLQFCKEWRHLFFFSFLSFLGFCVITFVLIKNKTHKALQNDRLNLSFVKDVHIVGEKMARSGCKTAI